VSKVIFRILGGLALLFAGVLFVGGIFTILRYPPRSVGDCAGLLAVIVALGVGGLGLFYLRKWAALLFSGMTLCVATWEIKSALVPIPGNASWLGFIFAVPFVIPAILTVMFWRTLVWSGKRVGASTP